MAFGARVINPIDFKPSTALGISVSFNAPGVFNSTYISKDATKNNLINFFLTNPSERYLNPTFGAGLRAFIFEQITSGNLEFLKENIESQIRSFFPTVLVQDLQIIPNNDYNSILVSLTYNVIDTSVVDTIQLEFT
jgi:phage baseplate assembly protein W